MRAGRRRGRTVSWKSLTVWRGAVGDYGSLARPPTAIYSSVAVVGARIGRGPDCARSSDSHRQAAAIALPPAPGRWSQGMGKIVLVVAMFAGIAGWAHYAKVFPDFRGGSGLNFGSRTGDIRVDTPHGMR